MEDKLKLSQEQIDAFGQVINQLNSKLKTLANESVNNVIKAIEVFAKLYDTDEEFREMVNRKLVEENNKK